MDPNQSLWGAGYLCHTEIIGASRHYVIYYVIYLVCGGEYSSQGYCVSLGARKEILNDFCPNSLLILLVDMMM